MLFDRLREPSTWASFATGALSLGLAIPGDLITPISYILAGIASIAGILLKEKKK